MNRRAILVGGGAVALASGMAGASFASMGTMQGYVHAVAAQRAALAPHGGAREAVRFATLAANGHNTQPWRFRIAPNVIRIVPDMARRTPVVDEDDHHLYVSLGCALENMSLAAAALGMPGEAHFEASGEGAIVYEHVAGAPRRTDLCNAIPHRQSARNEYDGRAVSAVDLTRLASAAAIPGVDIVVFSERAQIDRVRELVVAGNSAQMSDRAFVGELKTWMRFNPRAALAHGDGLFSAASGNPTLPTWLGAPLFDLVFTAGAENDKYARQLASSSGVIVFSGRNADRRHWVDVGRSCQRFALQATVLGMKAAFINQPVEVPALRKELAALAGMPGRRPDLVMRFGYGPSLPMSPRRPIDAVIEA
ncbi:MAG: nitroreductase family protein [Burkholderiales bacterium]|nr:nitroreductase family protein [Burkholderiales bacterium]